MLIITWCLAVDLNSCLKRLVNFNTSAHIKFDLDYATKS